MANLLKSPFSIGKRLERVNRAQRKCPGFGCKGNVSMKFWVTGVLVLVLSLWSTLARAQDQVWLQIEATPSLATATERARAYGNEFVDVAGFSLNSGWYVIVLGPMPRDAAQERLANLRFERLVPNDSFLTDGRTFASRFWPLGDAAMPEAQPEPAPEPVAEPTPEPTPAPAPEPLQTAEPAPPTEPLETLAESRRAEAALSRDERREIQIALQWFGYYNSGIDGAFGPGSRGAISAWQTDKAAEATGVLTTRQRADLIAAWRGAVAEIGLANHVDAEAGISIDLPLGLIAFGKYAPPFVQFDPANDSGVQVLLISQPGDQAALAGLYEVLQSASIMPMDGPRALRGRSFEISGRSTEVESYAFAEQSGSQIKGYVVSWPLARASQMVSVLAAMKGSFRSTGPKVLDPGLVPLDEAQRAALMVGLAPRKPVLSRSGFYIDDKGAVATLAEAVTGCERVSIDGGIDMQVVFSDTALGLALLRPETALSPLGVAGLASALPDTPGEVAVAGYSFETALSRPVMTFGRFESAQPLDGAGALARLGLTALPGDLGGPVIDRNGAVLGMLMPRPDTGARQLPEDVAFLLPAPALAARLAEASQRSRIAEPALLPLAPEDMTRIGNELAVMVSCWR